MLLLNEADEPEELSISTLGCAAGPIFRTAATGSCRVNVPFLDTLAPITKVGVAGEGLPQGRAREDGKGGGLLPGTVLELYGASGSGKTEVALNAVCGWVLPRKFSGVGGVAVVVDMDFRVDVRRLRCLLLGRIRKALQLGQGGWDERRQGTKRKWSNGESETSYGQGISGNNGFRATTMGSIGTPDSAGACQGGEDTPFVWTQAAMDQVVLVRCVDDLEAFSVLETLKYDLDRGEGAGTPTLVVLDSLGSCFYERKAAESCHQGQSCFDYMIARCIGRMAQSQAVSVIACKPALFAGQRTVHEGGKEGGKEEGNGRYRYPGLEHKEYMPGQWSRLVTHRLTLVKEGGEGGREAVFSARAVLLGALQPHQPGPTWKGMGGGAGVLASHCWFKVEQDGICQVGWPKEDCDK
ncbi:hypothetical protein Naga_100099g2 [Nannochloropsis gaditana]|uniref:Uncharacterized protein n=1 Tax=Nannochloropsis gaditana TaxID=72520 RepID=W7U480_9STRA|nr:hypothetical protein Naga_100099g2 [Nannochloropsis gaditana]